MFNFGRGWEHLFQGGESLRVEHYNYESVQDIGVVYVLDEPSNRNIEIMKNFRNFKNLTNLGNTIVVRT